MTDSDHLSQEGMCACGASSGGAISNAEVPPLEHMSVQEQRKDLWIS